jgi:citrate synthase
VADERDYLQTWIGRSDPDHIVIGGLDLPTEVMGHLTLTELAFFLITQRRASDAERRLLDAVLVSLADHGLTPSALSARLT